MAGLSITLDNVLASYKAENPKAGTRYFLSADGKTVITGSGKTKVVGEFDSSSSTTDIVLNMTSAGSKDAPITFKMSDSSSKAGWTVNGTQGSDFWLISAPGNFNLSAGADSATLTSGSNGASVLGGVGNDTFVVSWKVEESTTNKGKYDWSDSKKDQASKPKITLTGGNGADVFDFTKAKNVDVTITDYKYGTDYILVSNDVMDVDGEVGVTPSDTKQLFTSDGKVHLANGVSYQAQQKGSFWQTGFGTQTNPDQVGVYFSGGQGTTVDASTENEGAWIVGNNNGNNYDVLRGGRGSDTLFAGNGDSVLGGRGNDSISVDTSSDTKSAVIGFSDEASAGNDTVSLGNVSLGYNSEEVATFFLGNGRLGTHFKGVNFTTDGFTLKGQDGTLTVLQNQGGTNPTTGGAAFAQVMMADLDRSYKTVLFADTIDGALTAKDAEIYYSQSTNGYLGFNDVATDMVIDLTNSGKLGDDAKYYNVTQVKGGTGDQVVMVGNADKATTLIASGGQTSLWGGSANDDVLVTGAGRDFTALSERGGKDTVKGFTTGKTTYSDVVYLLGTGLKNVEKTSANKITFTGTDGSSLVLETIVGGADDEVISYTNDGGENIYYGKVGATNAKSQFTYEGDVTAYVGGRAGSTLTVTEYGEDPVTVWLDGNAGKGYKNIGVVDGSNSSADLILGGTSAKETLKGGLGNNTLWGASGDDTLQGGQGTNTFVVGQGEGTNLITDSKSGDTVLLYNMTSSDIVKSEVKNKTNLVLSFKNGGTLQINNYATGANVYQTQDGYYSVENGNVEFTKTV